MHDQPTGDPVAEDNQHDWDILILLLDPHDQRPRSVAELVRQHGNTVQAVDAIDRLAHGGLIHRTIDDLVFPTRAAVYFDQIHG